MCCNLDCPFRIYDDSIQGSVKDDAGEVMILRYYFVSGMIWFVPESDWGYADGMEYVVEKKLSTWEELEAWGKKLANERIFY